MHYALAWIGFLLLVAGIVVLFRLGRRTVIMRYFAVTFALFYGLRAAILLSHLDVPYPEQFFQLQTLNASMQTVLFLVDAFIALFLAGYALARRVARGGLNIYVDRDVSLERMQRASIMLTAAATLVTAFLFVKFGGPAGVLRAGKVGHGLAGLYVLRVFAAAGAITAASTYVDHVNSKRFAASRWAMLVMAALNAYYVYLWGARSVGVIVLVMLLVGVRPRRQRGGDGVSKELSWRRGLKTSSLSVGIRFVFAVLLAIIVAFNLRESRANTINPGAGDTALIGQNAAGEISLALNATYFDASILAVQDNGHLYHYPTGADYIDGLRTLEPGFIASKTGVLSPGERLRAYYQPEVVNGWPVGSPISFYLNFGIFGLLLGGFATGLLFLLLANARHRAAASAYNLGIDLVTVALVLQLGIAPTSLSDVVLWWIPLKLVGLYIRGPRAISVAADGTPRGDALRVRHQRPTMQRGHRVHA